MKACSKCKAVKAAEEFYKNKNTKDGLSHWCSGCLKTNTSNYQKTNREKVRAYQKAWAQKNPEKIAKYVKSPEYNREKTRCYARTEKGKAYRRENSKKATVRLSDAYVRGLLKQRGIVAPTLDLIQLKREHVLLRRLSAQLNQEISTQMENKNGT